MLNKASFLRIPHGAEWSARRSLAVLLLILLIAGLRAILLSIAKPFWFDEVCTVLWSHLPSASAIWGALQRGADPQPPTYYFVEHFARRLFPDDHLGYRLPSILGALTTVACIYFILARRVSRLSALVGASFVLCTAAAPYAAEARPYALLLACISVAILAWQRIDDSRLYAMAMFACLAAAVSMHYYAVLVWPAFFLAEAAVWVFGRRFRWSAWLAILLGASPLLILIKLLLRFRRNSGGHLNSKPDIMQISYAHDWLFNVSGHWGLSFAIGITAIVLYLYVARANGNGQVGRPCASGKSIPIEELVLALVFLWLPLIAVPAALVGQGAMSSRYMLPTVLGGALAFGYAINELPLWGRELLLFLFLVQYASPGFTQAKAALHGTLLAQRESLAREYDAIADRVHEADLPVVVSDGLEYLPTVYYAPAAPRARLYYIINRDAALALSPSKSDAVDLALAGLRGDSFLQVEDYPGFLSRHRQFILVSSGDWYFQWLPARLMNDGYAIQFVGAENANLIFKVTKGS